MSNKKSKAAGGWDALKTAMHMANREGFIKTNCAMLKVNKPEGFDCPGCAWPDPKDPAIVEVCENGIKALSYEATNKKVDASFFARYSVSFLNSQSDHWLEAQGRLTVPVIYHSDSDHYIEISWSEAFNIISDYLKSLNHPNQAVFYTSGRTSNEAAFLYQLLGRMLGTNNFPDCSNMCHESSGVAMNESIGIGKGTVSLEDFDKADAIFVLGQNPGTNHPRMLTELQKASKRGADIVSFNPLRETGLESFIHPQQIFPMLTNTSTPLSNYYYQVKIGGDMAAVRAMIKYIFEKDKKDKGIINYNFIKKHCANFEEYKELVLKENWDLLIEQSGLSKKQIIEAAEVYINNDKVIVCWAMGLTQHRHGVATIQEVINLLLLHGNIGKDGAGACPVRGHSNVQGDRTVGINEKPSQEFLKSLGKVFDFSPPTEHGMDVVKTIEKMSNGDVKFFMSMGGNFASATPDTEYTFKAIKKVNLTVQVSTHLNRSHVIHGKKALILPCLGRSEKDIQHSGYQKVTVEDSMSMVHASIGNNTPASPNLKSEIAIVTGIAQRLFPNRVNWQELEKNYDLIRDKIAETIPDFHDYNNRIKTPGGFYLGNSARDKKWKTINQKANFTLETLPILKDSHGFLRLMTIRSHDQYNTTIYDLNDRYRGIKGQRRIIFMNENDIKSLGLENGERVDLISLSSDKQIRKAENFKVVAYNIPEKCAASYFPETNVLVGIKDIAKKSRTPMSKYIEIKVIKKGK